MTRMLSLSKTLSLSFVKKKIRGGKRILRIINNWRASDSAPLEMDRLYQRNYDYERVVHPWIVYVGSRIVPPKKLRDEIILGLVHRYECWNTQLQKIGEPYYLKIWLFDQTFFESQIVVAIRERIQWYENVFRPADRKLVFPFQHFAHNAVKCPLFQWTPAFEFRKSDALRRNLVWIGNVYREPSIT